MSEVTLVIVESPSKAKTISKILGKDYLVRATVGHIIDLPKKSSGNNIGVNLTESSGFQPTYEIMPDKKAVVDAILDAAKQCDNIILASDPDREGEAIAYHLQELLKDLGKPIKRAEFNEITKKGIKKGIDNLRDVDVNLFYSQQSRRVLDRIVGYTVSPVLSRRFKNTKLSAGRVQSVALKMIVEREREISQFIPKEYWVISAVISSEEGNFKAVYEKRPGEQEEAEDISNKILKSSLSISTVDNKVVEKKPSPPFNTADLQKAASAKLRFSADRTTKVSQTLYEQGLITYIRTDSYRVSDEAMSDVRDYISKKYPSLLSRDENKYISDDGAQDAHEAIRPSDISVLPESVTGHPDNSRLYRLIRDRFLASQMLPIKTAVSKYTVSAKYNSEEFILKASGKVLLDEGWGKIYSPEKEDTKTDSQLPRMEEGQEVKALSSNFERKETKPASRFNDGTLIDELKKRGIGRPSTYSAIITKLTERKYVKKDGHSYKPTEIGDFIYDSLNKRFSFMSYDFTLDIERELDMVAEGKISYEEVIKKFFTRFKDETAGLRVELGGASLYTERCPKCKSSTIIRESAFGKFAGCINFPDCDGKINL